MTLLKINDETVIAIIPGWGEEADHAQATGQDETVTLRRFFEDNADGFAPEDADALRAELEIDGKAEIGGGAAAKFTIKVIAEGHMAVIDLTERGRQLRDQGRTASLAGDKLTANKLYRQADRFERFRAPQSNERDAAIETARKVGAGLGYEPWSPPGGAA